MMSEQNRMRRENYRNQWAEEETIDKTRRNTNIVSRKSYSDRQDQGEYHRWDRNSTERKWPIPSRQNHMRNSENKDLAYLAQGNNDSLNSIWDRKEEEEINTFKNTNDLKADVDKPENDDIVEIIVKECKACCCIILSEKALENHLKGAAHAKNTQINEKGARITGETVKRRIF